MKIVLGVVGFLAFVVALIVGARALSVPPVRSPVAAPAVAALPAGNGLAIDNGAEVGHDEDGRAEVAADGEEPEMPALQIIKDGKPMVLGGKRPRAMLLHLWASWCGPCRAELPSILAFQTKGVADVLAVSVDDEWSSVVKYFRGQIPAGVAWDQKIVLEQALGVGSIPTTFLIDGNGKLQARWTGAQPWENPALEKEVISLLVK